MSLKHYIEGFFEFYNYNKEDSEFLINTYEKCITVINKELQQIDKFSLGFFPKFCCKIENNLLIFGAHTNDICIFIKYNIS